MSGDAVVGIGAAKLRVVLATLLLRANTAVGIDELVERLWGHQPPATPRPTVQTYAQRLRRMIGADRIVTAADGYQIKVERHELDLFRFRDLLGQARVTEDPAEQSDLLLRALSLWRGRPLIDVPSDIIQTVDVSHLEEERLEALERWFDAELALGRHKNVIGDLQAAAVEHSARERFHAQLILALYRCGRQAEAFEAYHRVRAELAEHLGVGPGPEVQALYQKILRNDPAVAAPRQPGGTLSPRAMSTPRELPPDTRDFVGRADVLGELTEILTGSGAEAAPPVVISGLPGVGKTALAVRVAHELRRRFPDGQLYVNLRGCATGSPLGTSEVLGRFLFSLGVPVEGIPSDVDKMVTLYRTLMADRRVLILLDNAASAAQVRPLLPNAPGCGVIVTSRNELRGLTALQAAKRISLGVLSPAEACALLRNTIGDRLVDTDLHAAMRLAELCGYLPLALRIAAANMAARHVHALNDYLRELSTGNRLASLSIDGDDEATVPTAFRLSYDTLTPEVAALFRILSLMPGCEFTSDAVAALAGVSGEEALRVLDQLIVANLVSRNCGGRYQLHDLIRLYAKEQCARVDDAQVVREAKSRLMTYYLCHVNAASVHFRPAQRHPAPQPATEFSGTDEAMTWMNRECVNVLETVIDGVHNGLEDLAWRLATSIRSYLVTGGRYRDDGIAALTVALRSAVDAGDTGVETAIRDTLSTLSATCASLVKLGA